ncbi:P-loop containing nucleoside triphosphate hydrolase protein [Chytridium lagenaria]|nr:P-loop containing nucleoside triphosphate hydrolase protein [Chytridium lagenaria]
MLAELEAGVGGRLCPFRGVRKDRYLCKPHTADPSSIATCNKDISVGDRGELLDQALLRLRERIRASIGDQANQQLTKDRLEQSDVIFVETGFSEVDVYNPKLFKSSSPPRLNSMYNRVFDKFGVMDPESPIFLWVVQPLYGVMTACVERPATSLLDVRRQTINSGIIHFWTKYSESNFMFESVTLRQRRCCLIFAESVAHINEICELLGRHGIIAKGIHASMKRSDRDDVLDEFKYGTFDVLVNCGVLTEGVDIPAIDCVILARFTRSSPLIIQMIGRGLRQHRYGEEDKMDGARREDLTGVVEGIEEKKRRIVLEDKDGDGLEDTGKAASFGNTEEERKFMAELFSKSDPNIIKRYDDLFAAKPQNRLTSGLHWIRHSQGVFIALQNNGYFGISQRGSADFVGYHLQHRPLKIDIIVSHDTLPSAISASESWINQRIMAQYPGDGIPGDVIKKVRVTV